ncbi:MAG TPA: DCC1-like thiol-disulfide oxidoreductase family protein [Thermoanaerobaculia bacterium]|nr:DCC1-like thiol-disulfide oxidoreductase family protein [Thermoanaerobaculia bacterium]
MTSKILVYDGDCPMCEAASALLVRAGLLPEERRRPFQSFEGEMADRLLAAGMQNEMAVIDPSGKIRTGIPGILGLLRETRAGWVARLLDRPWLHPVLTAGYHLVAYNRRTIAPPRRGPAFACACDPEYRPRWLLALIILLLAFAVGMTTLFGAVVAAETGLASPIQGAIRMLFAAGSGWVLLVLAALALQRETRLPFLGHLGMVMAGGLLVLVPSMLLAPLLDGRWMAGVFLLSVTASFLLMLRSLRRRLVYLELSPVWLAGWAAALWAGASVSIWWFYF